MMTPAQEEPGGDKCPVCSSVYSLCTTCLAIVCNCKSGPGAPECHQGMVGSPTEPPTDKKTDKDVSRLVGTIRQIYTASERDAGEHMSSQDIVGNRILNAAIEDAKEAMEILQSGAYELRAAEAVEKADEAATQYTGFGEFRDAVRKFAREHGDLDAAFEAEFSEVCENILNSGEMGEKHCLEGINHARKAIKNMKQERRASAINNVIEARNADARWIKLQKMLAREEREPVRHPEEAHLWKEYENAIIKGLLRGGDKPSRLSILKEEFDRAWSEYVRSGRGKAESDRASTHATFAMRAAERGRWDEAEQGSDNAFRLDNTWGRFDDIISLVNRIDGKGQPPAPVKHVTSGAAHFTKSGLPIVATFPSKSQPGTVRTVARQPDGSLSCDCPGWTRRPERKCSHTDAAKRMGV